MAGPSFLLSFLFVLPATNPRNVRSGLGQKIASGTRFSGTASFPVGNPPSADEGDNSVPWNGKADVTNDFPRLLINAGRIDLGEHHPNDVSLLVQKRTATVSGPHVGVQF